MAMLDMLQKGMKVLVQMVGFFVAIYATLFIGLLLIGVIVNTTISGDINVSGQFDTTPQNDSVNESSGIASAIDSTETDLQNTTDILTNPVTVLVSLIVVGVLVGFVNLRGFGGGRQGVQ